MISYSEILDTIKTARKEKGYSQEEFAEKLGINKVAYNRIETGKTKLSLERYLQILSLLEDILGVGSNLPGITDGQIEEMKSLKTEYEVALKDLVDLKNQLHDKEQLMQYFKRDIMELKSLLLGYMEDYQSTEKQFLEERFSKSDQKEEFEREMKKSMETEAKALASFVKSGFFTREEVENEFNRQKHEGLMKLFSKYLANN